ncbi:hypothetical protein [Granulosicoccus antarcticus]|uniref:VWFA domain-containing protein n=1 Tax=Granulosicoccus antarcticus IMCC3135 TaxID=1192854 RepID=A0A2Z2NYF1_9GAMM|nr:hypothetical protein [Granulosicoccus antarcticus]ASJ72797.1 hypothetical protein IMCC3135_13560 [Granulosicoccus antarcticus IMCC3135]
MSVLRKKSKAKNDRLGVWIFAVLGVVGSAVAAFLWWNTQSQVKYDDATGCPATGPSAKMVFLIDTSDQISPLQRLDLRKQIDKYIESAPTYAKIVIYSLVPDEETHVEKVFDSCKPRDGTAANALTENERILKNGWREKFAEPIKIILSDALVTKNSDESPILEALQYVSVAQMDDSDLAGDVQLIIGSDMLQNMPEYSHYRDSQDFSFYVELPYSQKTALSLPPIDVKLLYIARTGYETVQSRKHVLFWEQYFANAGAMIDSVKILPAGG